ncbi:uncharacterized protein PG986_011685 [Apiospora aurea]|uniref:Uncharacterized protein n=1 Tax=Apiospora aurea TaxID=335848 RepID=A0ABR1PXU7_9PEZI
MARGTQEQQQSCYAVLDIVPHPGKQHCSLDSCRLGSCRLGSCHLGPKEHKDRRSTRTDASSHPPLFDVNVIHRIKGNETIDCQKWDEYLPRLGWADSLFGSLRGTVAERYSTIKANTSRQERRRNLREIQTRNLLINAREIHSKTCGACGSYEISEKCPRKKNATLVQHGWTEVEHYFDFYRPEVPSKHEVTARYYSFRIQDNVEVKVVKVLNHMYPYMSYQPGEYVLQLISMSEATDRQQAIGIRVENQSAGYYMDFEDAILVPDGTVPFQPEEDLARFNVVRDRILRIVVAILGFKPGTTSYVPKTLNALFEPSELPYQQWEYLVAAWDVKFQKVARLPKAITFSVNGARGNFSEAAWLIRRLRAEKKLMEDSPDRESLFQLLEKLLCRMTEMEFDKLADQYLERLGREAFDCLKDGDEDKVLVYAAGAFPEDFKDIHSYYKTYSGYPQPAPFDEERLDEFRIAALHIINDQDFVKAVLTQVARELAKQGRYLDEDHDETIAILPAGAEPSASAQPESARKKRGRPPKKEGDPKGPYKRRQKA